MIYNLIYVDLPEVYIFTADEAKDKMVKRGKSNQHFIQVKVYDTEEFRDRWDKLEAEVQNNY